MKKTVAVLLLVWCCGGYAWSQTKVIAHRGFWDTEGSAQNSLAALKKAGEAGVYGSEFDVYILADGTLVVNHDDSIAGIGLETATWEQLKAVTLPNKEALPTLDQYLSLGKRQPGTRLVLEIKSHKRVVNEDRAVQAIVETVRRHGLAYQVDYIAFSMNVCKELKRQAPYSSVSYLNGDVSPADLKALGFEGLDYNHKVLREKHPEWIREAKELGLTINVWTVNTPELMRYFIDQQVDYITTDKPLELKAMLVGQD